MWEPRCEMMVSPLNTLARTLNTVTGQLALTAIPDQYTWVTGEKASVSSVWTICLA